MSRAQREEAVVAREEAETALRNTKKEIEAQELVRFLELWSSLIQISLSLSTPSYLLAPQNVALLEKKLSSVEEELAEARGSVEEERGREKEWREGRDFLQTDLKTTGKRLEDAYAELEKEKTQRWAPIKFYQTCMESQLVKQIVQN